MEDIRANFEIPVKTLQELCLERYGVTVQLSTMYKVKAEAVKQILGSHDGNYSKLPQYISQIMTTDPNAYAYLSWLNYGPESPLVFKRMFISFEAQYEGFIKGCRPLIGIDGCHLKGNYNGCLLSAIALDGNQQIFPIAYAVVGEESKDNWTYFFTSLRAALTFVGREDWVFMRQNENKNMSQFAETFPRPYFEAYFWQACDAYNEFVFLKAMENMKGLDAGAYNYLMDINLDLWPRFKFDPSICCGDNTNNFTESWNATLGLDRVRPIMGLLEVIVAACRHSSL
ncbi:Dystrophin-related protein 2 [Bienertia sinuspersici]